MRGSKPILKTVGAAVGCFSAVLALHISSLSAHPSPALLLLWFAGGLIYTQLLEYGYHKIAMHRGIRHLEGIKWNHLTHHRVFYGDHFRSRDPEDLAHIAGRWHIFPLLFFLHYLILWPLLAPAELLAFLTAATAHYVLFEVTHWFTHVEDNAFDRWVARIPVLGRLRERQILHHQIHHETPEVAFNFNPPFLGDLIAGSLPRTASVPAPKVPAPVPVVLALEAIPAPALAAVPERRAAWSRQAVWYGSAVVVGVAALALAGALRSRYLRSKPVPGVRRLPAG